MVESPPANAENKDPIPGPGRTHMLRSNQAHAPTTAPARLEPVLC